MPTPLFPAFRARLAALGRRTAGHLRQATLQQLAAHLAELIPVHLLASADDGPNSRARLFTLPLTCECFLWQMLKPRTACREVVRQVQALACLRGKGAVDENASALHPGPPAPAPAPLCRGGRSRRSTAVRCNCRTRRPTRGNTRSRPASNPVAVFP